jgi:hypothetical protein
VKVNDIVGHKKRRHRSSRKHRKIQPDNLYHADAKKLDEVAKQKGRDINHLEDLVIFYGSSGAKQAIAALRKLESNPQETTIKWDGSPALIFGRDDQGEFILTDKSGFSATTYDGRVKSADELQSMFLNRKLKDPSKAGERKKFAQRMASMWNTFESATPESFRGYVHGDLLYSSTPNEVKGKLNFQPNTTLYSVEPSSDIGKKISNSKIGIVIHAYIDLEGNKSKPDSSIFQGSELLVMPPVYITDSPEIDDAAVKQIEDFVSSNAQVIDKFLSIPPEMKMGDWDNILYAYINASTKANDLDDWSPKNFLNWVAGSKLSNPKKQKATDWVKNNPNGYQAVFNTVSGLMKAKNAIIAQLDKQPADIKSFTNGQEGGEGYVIGKDIKLVNRGGFTAANFARPR